MRQVRNFGYTYPWYIALVYQRRNRTTPVVEKRIKVTSMKIVVALCFLLSAPLYAGTAVIVNANNNSGVDIDTVKKIYLGKMKAFPDGSRAIPLTFEQGNDTRNAFNNGVLGKSESQYSAFWSKLVFTGRGTPPEMIATDEEMLQLVATNPNTIGFIDESKVSGDVKIVGTF
jgi:hypothetical protein